MSKSLVTVKKLVITITGNVIILADKKELKEFLTENLKRDQEQ